MKCNQEDHKNKEITWGKSSMEKIEGKQEKNERESRKLRSISLFVFLSIRLFVCYPFFEHLQSSYT